MLAYKPATVKEQKIIDNINKPIKPIQKQTDYNSEWHITAEDLALMLISSTVFALLIVFLV
jgi:hypothetical protein